MKQKEILLFGASGQIGRNLIRKLSKNNYKITAVTRNIHRNGYILKTQANPGYLDLVELENFNIDKVGSLIKNCTICINLIGILYEKKKINLNLYILIYQTCYLKKRRNLKLKNLYTYLLLVLKMHLIANMQ